MGLKAFDSLQKGDWINLLIAIPTGIVAALVTIAFRGAISGINGLTFADAESDPSASSERRRPNTERSPRSPTPPTHNSNLSIQYCKLTALLPTPAHPLLSRSSIFPPTLRHHVCRRPQQRLARLRRQRQGPAEGEEVGQSYSIITHGQRMLATASCGCPTAIASQASLAAVVCA